MGAANRNGARRPRYRQVARIAALRSPPVGDDVLDACKAGDLPIMEFDGTIKQLGNRLLSANAYLGVEPMAQALAAGADIVITGRASDPALFLAPMIHAFGWAMDDWNLLGQGTVAGHLLECAGQITGGYFADPGYKDVADLARLGFPIGEVGEDGSLVITKVAGSGGAVTAQTCKEQLLYEVHDPRYLQPDVVADCRSAKSRNRAGSRPCQRRAARSEPTLKVRRLVEDISRGQIYYAGPGAWRGDGGDGDGRERLKRPASPERLRLNSRRRFPARPEVSDRTNEPYEVRVRVRWTHREMREAVRIGNEVETAHYQRPAAGGGAWKSARDVVALARSCCRANGKAASPVVGE